MFASQALHQMFVDNVAVLTLVHEQGYDVQLLQTSVEGIPSLRPSHCAPSIRLTPIRPHSRRPRGFGARRLRFCAHRRAAQ